MFKLQEFILSIGWTVFHVSLSNIFLSRLNMDFYLTHAEGWACSIVHNIKTSYFTLLFSLLTCGCTMFSPSTHPFIKKYLWGLCPMWGTVLVAGGIRSVAPPRSLPSWGSPSGSSCPDTSAFLCQRDACQHGLCNPFCHWLTQFLQLRVWGLSLTNSICLLTPWPSHWIL